MHMLMLPAVVMKRFILSYRSGSVVRTRLHLCCVCLILIALASPMSTATASPWTLPQHDLVVSSDFSFARASREYLNSGRNQDYSVNGQLRTSTLALGLRYGFTDRFEMEVRPTFETWV